MTTYQLIGMKVIEHVLKSKTAIYAYTPHKYNKNTLDACVKCGPKDNTCGTVASSKYFWKKFKLQEKRDLKLWKPPIA